MKYRKLDANGDYTFGKQSANFLADSPETVSQAISTRLHLDKGEWFVNTEEGTPYSTEILGTGTIGKYDFAIQDRIINTPGVTKLVDYYSYLNTETRQANIFCTVDTIYGAITIQAIL